MSRPTVQEEIEELARVLAGYGCDCHADGEPYARDLREANGKVRDLVYAARVAYEVLSKNRLSGMDQNPKGVKDLLCSALVDFGGMP